MKIHFIARLLLMGSILLSLCLVEVANSQPKAQSIEVAIDQLLEPFDRSDAPGLAVGVIFKGETIYSKGWGMADLENKVRLTPDSVFDIASVSKQFAGMAVAILESENKLKLNDRVMAHVHGLPDVFNPVSLDHLLHHTSGIRDWPGTLVLGGRRFDDVIEFDDILEMARRQEALSFTPGDKFSYSNTGYNLLARTVETVTGNDFSNWMKENVFHPLDMTDSHFHDNLGRVIPRRVRSYQGNKNGPFRNVGNQLMALGSSSLYSTVNDLLKWMHHFEDPKITTSDVIQRMMEPGKLNNGNSTGYAYGFGIGKYRGTKRVSHSGAWAGFRTYLLYLPEFQFGVVVLSNWSGLNTSSYAYKIANLVLDNDPSKPVPLASEEQSSQINAPISFSDVDWKKWQGIYSSTGNSDSVIQLFERNAQPWIELPDGRGFKLLPTSTTEFVHSKLNIRVSCSSGINGWPKKLSIKSPDWTGNAEERASANFEESELKDYVGIYQSTELLTEYRIEESGRNLKAIHHRHAPVLLQRFSKDRFTSKVWYWSQVDFDRDSSGKISGLRVTQGRNHNMLFRKKD